MQGMRVKNHKNQFNQNWSSVRSKGGSGKVAYPAFWEKNNFNTFSAEVSSNNTNNVLKFPVNKSTSKSSSKAGSFSSSKSTVSKSSTTSKSNRSKKVA